MNTAIVSASAVAAIVIMGWTSAVKAQSFQQFDFTPGDGTITGASNDGSVVVGYTRTYTDPTAFRAFRWTQATGMIDLGLVPGFAGHSFGMATNSDGSVVVGSGTDNASFKAFRWTSSGGMAAIPYEAGDDYSVALGVNADGSVVVGARASSTGSPNQASRWTAATGMVGLGTLPGDDASTATAVSADGSVVVGLSTNSSTGIDQAFRWTAATGMVALGFLPGDNASLARGVSVDGSVVVGISVGELQDRAFRWTAAGGMVDLGVVRNDIDAIAQATNANGTVVVGASQGQSAALFNSEAFRWTASTGMKDIRNLLTIAGVNIGPFFPQAASAVSPDGTVIAGYGRNGDGAPKGWVATIPVPAATPCTVTFTPTDTPVGQPARNLALMPLICQTNPTTGACINPTSPGASSTVNVNQNDTVFFSTFVQGQGIMVPFDPANNRIFVIAKQGTTPVGEASAAVKMTSAGATMRASIANPATTIVSAIAPNARTTSPNTAVTAFGTIINAGTATANACSLALPSPLPSGVAANFLYQTTNPATNVPNGTPNTPVDIPAGAAQSFYFAITPTTSFSEDLPIVFVCTNTNPAPVFPGLNTFLLTSTTTPIADMLSIGDTLTHDGIIGIDGLNGTGLLATASVNLRACQ